MATVIMLVGLPGSGKSTWAAQQKGAVVVSSDQMRIDRGGDQTTHTRDRDFWDDVRAEVAKLLKLGHDVIFDATNIDPKWRVFNSSFFLVHGAAKVVVKIFTTPLEDCLSRNALREGAARIDDEVIHHMAEQLERYPPRAGQDGLAEVEEILS